MAKQKNILTLGGEGFIGRNLSFLQGKYNMVSCGIEESKFTPRKDKFLGINPYIEKTNLDYDFDIIIHLIDNKVDISDFVNQESNLADNLKLKSGCHFIVFSSAVIYANPDSEYAKRKKLLENFWSEYCQKNKINLTILRLFNTFGLYQQPNRQGSLVANIFSNHLNDILIEINDMNAERDFVFSKDITKIVDCVISENIYGLHDIASSKMISVSDLLKKIEEVINKPLRFEDKGNTEKIICPLGSSFLYDKIKPTDFDEALSQTYNFYLEKP